MINRTSLLLAGLGLLAIFSVSCAPVSYLVATFLPPPEIKAVYELPKGKRILVFTDDLGHPLAYPPLKRILAEKIDKQFLDQKLVAETISYDKLLDLQARNSEFDRLSVDQVGTKLGAELVLFVQIDEFRLQETPGAPIWQGMFTVRVRVVDPASGRLWPKDGSAGYTLTVQTPMSQNANEAYGAELAEDLAGRMADKIAKLFYTHRGPPVGSDDKYQ